MMGSSLKALRAHLGRTQVQMAEALHVSEHTYVAYETAARTPCDRVLDTLLELVLKSAPEFEERIASKVQAVRASRRESPDAGPPIGAQTSSGAKKRRQNARAAAAHRSRLLAIKAVHEKRPGAPAGGRK